MIADEYRALVGELTELERRRAEDLAAAEQSYVDDTAAVARALTDTARRHEDAAARERAAEADIASTDARAALLWLELRALVGRWAGRRIGPVPVPVEPPSTVDVSGAVALHRAGLALTRSRRRVPGQVGRGFVFLLPILGAAGAGLVLLLVRLIGAVLGAHDAVLDALAQLVVFLAPFAGIPVAYAIGNRWYGRPPDTGGIGLTALGGMLAACLIVTLLR